MPDVPSFNCDELLGFEVLSDGRVVLKFAEALRDDNQAISLRVNVRIIMSPGKTGPAARFLSENFPFEPQPPGTLQ